MKPDVCLDARMLQASGIGTYLRGILEGLKAENDISLVELRKNSECVTPQHIPTGAPIYSLREQWEVPYRWKKTGARLLHVPHYNVPVAALASCVVTVHDLIHLRFPDFLPNPIAKLYAKVFFHHLIPRCRAILTVSEHTRKDLVELLGIPRDRITVTYPGVPQDMRRPLDNERDATLKSLNLSPGYFLYVGNLRLLKNIPWLIDVYEHWCLKRPDAPPLLLVGRSFIPGLDSRLRGHSKIRLMGEQPRHQLSALYAGALAVVFPSLYEGFGIPPLEAFACGTPVVCSNRASLPEVVGDAALTFDPTNPEALETALDRIVGDAALRDELVRRGSLRLSLFSYAKAAQQTVAVYRQCLKDL